MSEAVRKEYTKRGLTPPKCNPGRKHHSQKFHEMVAAMKAEGKVDNPYAVAMSKLGKRRAFKR